jgi:hypothetical protein
MQNVSSKDSPRYSQAAPRGKAEADGVDLDARSRAWQRTGAAAVLWPGIDLAALNRAADAIADSAASCLDGRRSRLAQADDADARTIGIAALILGVGPLLGYWIERGLLDASAPVAHVLGEHLRHNRARMAGIVDGVRPALQALRAAGIQPILLKGFHTAHAYFPEAGVRPFSDVDVVVRPAEIADAERILSSLGFAPGTTTRPYKRDWLPPGVDRRIRSLELWHAESPWSLELQSGLFFADLHRYGVDFGEPEGEPGAVAGVAVRLLPVPLRLVTTAAHCSTELQAMRLLRLIEMIFMIRAETASHAMDWAAVEDVLDRSRATRFTYPCFALIEQLAPGTIPSRLVDRARRESSRLACRIVTTLRPATPLLVGGISLAERSMWVSGPADCLYLIRRLSMLDGRKSWSEALAEYQRGLALLVRGRIGVSFRR